MTDKAGRMDLFEALKPGGYEHAIICSYTYSARFFEEHSLRHLEALRGAGQVSLLVDRGQYEAALQSSHRRPRRANIDYYLHPVDAAGVFHPKLVLLAGKKKGRLLVGSANFSRAGLSSNAEMVGCFDFVQGRDESSLGLFQDAFAFLQQLAEDEGDANVRLRERLEDLEEEAGWLGVDAPRKKSVSIRNNLSTPLFDQLLAGISGPVEEVRVLSRYFDSTPRALERVFEALDPRKVLIYTENETTTLKKEWFNHPLVKSKRFKFLQADFGVEGEAQQLHAKAFAIVANGSLTVAYGSANFTMPGMFRTSDNGNVETMVVVQGIDKKAVDLDALFDPEANARTLKAEDLRTAPDEEEPTPAVRQIRVLNAALEGDHLIITVTYPDNAQEGTLRAELTLQTDVVPEVKLAVAGRGQLKAKLAQELQKQLRGASTVVQLFAATETGEELVSNPVCLVSLRESEGSEGGGDRTIGRATKNIDLFLSVLEELWERNDEDEVVRFLNLCNIPVRDIGRLGPGSSHVGRIWGEPRKGLGQLSAAKPTLSKIRHAAAIQFVRRHIVSIGKHVAAPSVGGVQNFAHIVGAVAEVLLREAELVVEAFEHEADLSVESWGRYRDYVSEFFREYKGLLSAVVDGYLGRIGGKEYRKIRTDLVERLAEDLPPLEIMTSSLVALHHRFEGHRSSKCKVIPPGGRAVVPSYVSRDVFHPAKWPALMREFDESGERLASVGASPV
jgi:hypothetical protein